MRIPVRGLLLALLALVTSGCATWKPIHTTGDWTLFVKDGARVDVEGFGAALDPAFEAVEARMGAFEDRVNVHAWEGDAALHGGRGGMVTDGDSGELELVPGIGPARVRAFHVRAGSHPFAASGVFLGTSDVGTAVHELVHARLAEQNLRVPLWFEEGLASLYGDGAFHDDEWVVDGLACWPLRELREQKIDDVELERLLSIGPRDDYDARENLLVHFVGWAIVFDLMREKPDGSWEDWLGRFEGAAAHHGRIPEARRRVERTLGWQTHVEWLERLGDEDPGVRLATAKGVWKLHSRTAVDAMLDRLEIEEDPEVRFGLALNCMLATGEIRLGRERWWRLRNLVFPVLREPELDNDEVQLAGERLYAALRRWDSRRRSDVQESIEILAPYWEE